MLGGKRKSRSERNPSAKDLHNVYHSITSRIRLIYQLSDLDLFNKAL